MGPVRVAAARTSRRMLARDVHEPCRSPPSSSARTPEVESLAGDRVSLGARRSPSLSSVQCDFSRLSRPRTVRQRGTRWLAVARVAVVPSPSPLAPPAPPLLFTDDPSTTKCFLSRLGWPTEITDLHYTCGSPPSAPPGIEQRVRRRHLDTTSPFLPYVDPPRLSQRLSHRQRVAGLCSTRESTPRNGDLAASPCQPPSLLARLLGGTALPRR